MAVQWTGDDEAGKWRVVEVAGGGVGQRQRLISGKCTETVAYKIVTVTKRALWEKGWREGRGDGRMWLGREWREVKVVEAVGEYA